MHSVRVLLYQLPELLVSLFRRFEFVDGGQYVKISTVSIAILIVFFVY